MTNPQDKELSSEQTSAWMNDMQERLIAQSAEIASEGHCGWGNTMAEAACLLKQIQIELAAPPQLPVAEQPAGQAVDTKEWLRQESSVYALNERGVNSDYINVQQADNRHDRAATNDLAERIRMLLSQPLSPVAQMSGDALEQIDLKAQAGLCTGCGAVLRYQVFNLAWGQKSREGART